MKKMDQWVLDMYSTMVRREVGALELENASGVVEELSPKIPKKYIHKIFRKYPNQRFSTRVITKDIFEPPQCSLIQNKYLE